MNRGEVRSRIVQALRESSTPVRWSEDELNRYIDDGYLDIAERTGVLIRDRNVTVNKETAFVALDPDTLFPIAVKDLATDYPIDFCHFDFIDREDSLWIRRKATRPLFMSAWDLEKMIIWPTYSASSGGTIVFTEAFVPSKITSDSFEFLFPEDYHHALVHYGHARALEKDADGPMLGRSLRQMGQYEEIRGDVKTWAFSRHQGIFRAVYGIRLRTPQHVSGLI